MDDEMSAEPPVAVKLIASAQWATNTTAYEQLFPAAVKKLFFSHSSRFVKSRLFRRATFHLPFHNVQGYCASGQ
jgi:hypothetical protein